MAKTNTKQVIILGVGGYSANLVEMMHDINKHASEELWSAMGILDDNTSLHSTLYFGLPVLGSLNDAHKFEDAFFINAIGSSKSAAMKAELIARTNVPRERFATLCHPSAYISASAKIGVGCVIAQKCVILANTVIGDHVKTLPLATVSYGSRVGDFSTIAGGVVIAAEVEIGTCSYIGANVSVRERIKIGNNTIVGMGGVVVHDVADNTTVMGVPARPIT